VSTDLTRTEREPDSGAEDASGPATLTRDFLVFEGKVLLNGLTDLVMAPLAALAFFLDIVSTGGRTGTRFYGLLRMGRRWDAWLRLFRPVRQPDVEATSLASASTRGADHLIAHLETMARAGEMPEPVKRRLEALTRRLDKATGSHPTPRKQEHD